MKLSRRLLARYIVDQLNAGAPANKVARAVAASLVEHKLQAQTDLLIADIAWELEQRGEQSNVTVTSASSLTEELRKEIKALVKAKSSVKDVHLDEVIDASVIGGVRIDSPSKTWDKTVKQELIQLREAF